MTNTQADTVAEARSSSPALIREIVVTLALVAMIALPALASARSYSSRSYSRSYTSSGTGLATGLVIGTMMMSGESGANQATSGCAQPETPEQNKLYKCLTIGQYHWILQDGVVMYCQGIARDYGNGRVCRKYRDDWMGLLGATEAAKPVSIQQLLRNRFDGRATLYSAVQQGKRLYLTVVLPLSVSDKQSNPTAITPAASGN